MAVSPGSTSSRSVRPISSPGCARPACQPLAGFLGDELEEVDHHVDRADEVILAQLLVLGCDTGGAVVQVADAQVLAAQGNHRCSPEAEAFGAEDRGLDHVQASLQATIGLHPDLAPQVIAAQGLVGSARPSSHGEPA